MAVWASADALEVFGLSRVGDRWVLTGTIDEDDAKRITKHRPRLSVVGTEEMPLADMLEAHRTHVGQVVGAAEPIPRALEELLPLHDDYLSAAVG